jgi:hypothetical protein
MDDSSVGTYIIALVFVVIVLFSAVRLHLFFGLHRVTKREEKAKARGPRMSHTRNLREHLFGKH